MFELGDDVVAYRRLDPDRGPCGQWLPAAWHRECLNAEAEKYCEWTAGPQFEIPTNDDLVIAWVGTATGKGASENLDEKLRDALAKSREWRPVAVAIENGRVTDITSEVFPTYQQLEAALRYVWEAWSEAEGSGQPYGWVFGPGADIDAHMAECGETPRPRASPEIQETIRRVIGVKR